MQAEYARQRMRFTYQSDKRITVLHMLTYTYGSQVQMNIHTLSAF